MSEGNFDERERALILAAVARLRAGALAAALAAAGGAALFLATAVLLLSGGEQVGYHLARLRWYLPGYTVSWGGAMLGAVYGALLGGGAGALIATIYNRVAARRDT